MRHIKERREKEKKGEEEKEKDKKSKKNGFFLQHTKMYVSVFIKKI